jgi:hypothetical protein
MDYALDVNSKRLVVAHQATKYRSFVCPECKGGVYLASGYYQDPHFRHNPGSFANNCSLYHPSWTVTGKLMEVRERDRRERREPALFASASKKTWSLELFVPDIDLEYDVVQIAQETGKTKLAKGAVRPRGCRVPVQPREAQYTIEYRGARHVVEELVVPGLDKETRNLFRHNELGGRTLPPYEPLFIGDTYTVICDRVLSFEAIDALQLTRVGVLGSWVCFTLRLTGKTNDRIRRWVQKHFARDLAQTRPGFAITFPPLSDVMPDGTQLVAVDDDLIVSLQGSPGAWIPDAIAFRDVSGAQSEWLPAPSSMPATYQLAGVTDNRYELTAFDLQSDENTAFHFQVGSREPIVRPLPAVLVTKDSNTATEHISPLYSEAAVAQTKRLLVGESVAIGLHVPGGAPIRIVANGVTKTFEPVPGESIIGAPGSSEYERRISREFCELLTESVAELLIDAGDFGRVDVHQSEMPETPVVKNRRLAPDLRNRLLWLMQSAMTLGRSIRMSPKSAGQFKGFSTADQVLIDQFIGIKGWPKHLQPLVGAVTQDLMRRTRATE